jgi:hypothetical protein
MSQATFALISGDFQKAYRSNLLVFVLVPFVIWGILDAIRIVSEIRYPTNH